MPQPSNIRKFPSHWRIRAREARMMACEMSDDDMREAMIEVAKAYEKVAVLADEEAEKRKSK
jgi:hypothetical protein